MKYVPFALLALLFSLPAAADEEDRFQIHGFASQAFVLTEGNDLYGDSTQGSFQYHEAGLNGSYDAGYGLLLSAQVVARDAGKTDDAGVRLDYALADYRYLPNGDTVLGVRGGRVKNPLGLFNDTRDMVFTRPGILLPQSVYLDTLGLRSIFFSTDGGQLYGDIALGDHNISAVVTAGISRDATDEEVRQLGGAELQPSNIRFKDLLFARLLDEIDGGRIQLGFSIANASVGADMTMPVPSTANLDASVYVLSARYNAARWNLTAEYSQIDTEFTSSLAAPQSSKGDGFYLQYGYLFTPQWSAYARYDATFRNRNDRDGRDVEAAGGSRYSQFAHDGVLGLSWKDGNHWGLFAEHHLIYGSATVSADNAGKTPDTHWSAFLLMAAYRF